MATEAGKVEEVAAVVDESADDIFAKAFEQLSAADNAANVPEPKVVLDPLKAGRTEEDRATSEAQRDAATFAKAGPTGPPGVAAVVAATGGIAGAGGATGPSGAITELPPDDKEKAALAATEAAKIAAAAVKEPVLADDDIVKRLAGLIGKAAPVEQQTQTEVQQVDPLAIFSEADKQFLAAYEKEYPDIAKAEFMRRRVEYQQVVAYVFGEIDKVLKPKFESIDTLLQRTHAGDLQLEVPSYSNDLREKVVAWTATQKPYKRVAYEHVINQGTVDEVKDLIEDFTKATNYVAPVKAPVQAAQVQQTQQVVDPAKAAADAKIARAAAALAPVTTKNANRAVTVIAPGDFDGAFDWATRELANI